MKIGKYQNVSSRAKRLQAVPMLRAAVLGAATALSLAALLFVFVDETTSPLEVMTIDEQRDGKRADA